MVLETSEISMDNHLGVVGAQSPKCLLSNKTKVNSKPLAEDMPICPILIDKHVNKIPYAKIRIYDGDPTTQAFEIANDKIFAVGPNIIIEAGYGDGDPKKLFERVIVKFAIKSNQDWLSIFVITCKDIAFKTTILPKIAHYEKIKDSDLFKKISQAHGDIKSRLETVMVNVLSILAIIGHRRVCVPETAIDPIAANGNQAHQRCITNTCCWSVYIKALRLF